MKHTNEISKNKEAEKTDNKPVQHMTLDELREQINELEDGTILFVSLIDEGEALWI